MGTVVHMTTAQGEHRISWYVFAWNHGTGQHVKMRHAANMRGTWGWDAECSCGWGSHTGGATKRSVDYEVWSHKFETTGRTGPTKRKSTT